MTARVRCGFAAGITAIAAVVMAACGSDVSPGGAETGEGRPTIAVTTNILGDVVGELVGDRADVVTIMPVGADPHDFQPSAQEVDALLSADAVIVNGGDLEESLLDVVDSAREEGVPVFETLDAVETIEFGTGGHDHEDEDHGDEPEHDHDGVDPHFFTDPARMADAVDGIAAFLSTKVSALDADALDASVDDYLGELDALGAEVEELIAEIPEDRRILVTNHEVFGYFADHYGFEVVEAVIPGGATIESADPGDLAELAEVIETEGVPAIFADTSSSSGLVETLAAEVGDVEIVELYSESLGEPGSGGETYLDIVRTNATRINQALS